MKVTAELTDKAKAYYNEVAYGLDFGDGKCATQTQVINYMLETLSDIEEKFGDPVNYLIEHGKDYGKEAGFNLYKPQKSIEEKLYCGYTIEQLDGLLFKEVKNIAMGLPERLKVKIPRYHDKPRNVYKRQLLEYIINHPHAQKKNRAG